MRNGTRIAIRRRFQTDIDFLRASRVYDGDPSAERETRSKNPLRRRNSYSNIF